MFINGSPPRGASARRDTVVHGPHGCSATSIDQLVAPVAVDLRGGHPLTAEEAGLHRVLGVVAGRGTAGGAGSATSRRRPVLRRDVEPARGTRASDIVVAEHGQRRGTRPGGRGSGRTCCRTGTCGRRRWPRRSRRSARRRSRGRAEVEPGQRRRVVGRQPGPDRDPAEPVGRLRVGGLGHLGPEHADLPAGRLAAERPEPPGERPLTGSRLERRRCLAVPGAAA